MAGEGGKAETVAGKLTAASVAQGKALSGALVPAAAKAALAYKDVEAASKDLGPNAAKQITAALGGVSQTNSALAATAAQADKATGAVHALNAAVAAAPVSAGSRSAPAEPLKWRDMVAQRMGPLMREFSAEGVPHAEAHTKAIRQISEEWKRYKETGVFAQAAVAAQTTATNTIIGATAVQANHAANAVKAMNAATAKGGTAGQGQDTAQMNAFAASTNKSVAELSRFAAANAKAEAAAERLADANARNEVAQARLASATARAAAAQSAFDKASQSSGASQDQIAAAQMRQQSAQAALSVATVNAAKEQKSATKAAEDHRAALSSVGKQSTLTAFQSQQLGFQLHDFFVQIASGQNPLTAFVQQGSQLSGTFGGAGNAFRAVTSLITPMRLAIGGAAAVLGVLGFSFYEGTKQSKAFADAITLTGNYAGKTEGQFNALAKSVAASGNVTVAAAREYTQALIATGEIGPQVLSSAARVAAEYGQATGRTAQEVAKDFAKMAESPSKFAVEANRSLNFITAKQYEAIKAFEEAGRSADAQGVIYDALNERLKKLPDNLGTIERTLRSGKNAWSSFWDAAYDIGRTETVEAKLEKVNAAIEKQSNDPRKKSFIESLVGRSSNAQREIDERNGSRPENRSLDANLATRNELSRREIRETENAFAEAHRAETQKAGIAARVYGESALKAAKDVGALNRELAENAKQVKAAAAAGTPFSDKEIAAMDAATRKKFAGPAGSDDRKAKLLAEIEDARAQSEQLNRVFTTSENIMEAAHASGLLSEKDFYEAKREFIRLETDARLQGLQEEKALIEQFKPKNPKEEQEKLRDLVKVNRQIGDVQTEAAAKTEVLSTREQASISKIQQAYLEARNSAQSFLDTITRSQERELASVGLGDAERQRLSGRQQIEDRFFQQRTEAESQKRLLEGLGKFNSDEQKKYDDRLALINEFQKKALDSFDRYYSRLKEMESDAASGSSRAIQNYLDGARNMAAQTDNLVSGTLRGVEDEFVRLSATGKASFKDLVNSIAGEISRIGFRQLIARGLNTAKSGGFGEAIASITGKVTAPPVGAVVDQTAAEAVRLGLSGGRAATQQAAALTAQTSALTESASALVRLQQAADSAASALQRRSDNGVPISESATTEDANSGERSIRNLFGKTEEAQTDAADSAEALSKQALSVTSDLELLAQSAQTGGNALALLPGLVRMMMASNASSSGGNTVTSLISAAFSAFSGGSSMGDAISNDASGSLFSATGDMIRGRRAIGGPVGPNSLYEVNEKGPEVLEMDGRQYLMTGKQGGKVIANSDLLAANESVFSRESSKERRTVLTDLLLRVGVKRPMVEALEAMPVNGARELGGPVSAGRMYRVNEKRPELLNVGGKQYLMMGNQGGSIAPDAAPAKGSSTVINVQVTPPPGASRQTAMQFGAEVARQSQLALRRNG
jgi:lambda family phage tail tape measure protein